MKLLDLVKARYSCRSYQEKLDNEEPVVLIPIGYAADEPKEKKRKEIEKIWTSVFIKNQVLF